MGTVDDSVTTNTKHQNTKAYNMVKGENGTMDPGGNARPRWRSADAQVGAGSGGGAVGKRDIHTPSISVQNGEDGRQSRGRRRRSECPGRDDWHAGRGNTARSRPTPGATAEEAAGEGLTSTTVQVRGPTVDKTTERDKHQNTRDSTDTTQQHRMTLGTVCDIFTRFRYSTEDGENDIILSGIPDGRTKEQRTLLEAHGMARRHQAPTANDAFDPALWETFVSTTLGLEVPT